MSSEDEKNINIAYRSCPLCGSDYYHFLKQKGPMQIVECETCSLVYQNPFMPDDDLELNRPEDEAVYEKYYEDFLDTRRPALNIMFNLLEKYCKPPGKFFDIGCGFGQIMAVAKERGWEARGLDLTLDAVNFCNKRGYDVFHGTFQECALEKESMNVVCIHNVIEVLVDPVDEVKRAYDSLVPGGILLMKGLNSVFHVSSYRFYKMAKPVLQKVGIGDPSMFHRATFSKKTIKRLAVTTGFEMMECVPAPFGKGDPNQYLKKTGSLKKAYMGAFKAYNSAASAYFTLSGGKSVIAPSYIAVLKKP